jgi:uncharacterized protein YecE (DUF72 family)
MPKPALFERWRDTVPDDFRFAIKAPRRITHVQKLQATHSPLEYFVAATTGLEHKLGPVLFQLPPFMSKDRALLTDFLTVLPPSLLVAFEFRHASWFEDEIFALLAEHNAALCGGDADSSERSPPLVATANFGYLRLRAPSYDDATLHSWAERILDQPWDQAYVFLKHEVLGPNYALFLAAVIAGNPAPTLASAKPSKRKSRAKSKIAPPRGRLVPE